MQATELSLLVYSDYRELKVQNLISRRNCRFFKMKIGLYGQE